MYRHNRGTVPVLVIQQKYEFLDFFFRRGVYLVPVGEWLGGGSGQPDRWVGTDEGHVEPEG